MLNQNKILRVFQLITALKRKPSKKIEQLANLLETTNRTVYRYLDLLRELDFEIEKDALNHYRICNSEIEEIESFSKQETDYLVGLIKNNLTGSILNDSLMRKIKLNSTTKQISEDLIHIKIARIMDNLTLAIDSKIPIIINNYHSVNSNTISNRNVEPFAFTPDLTSLIAYEPSKKENKFFKLDRISDVTLLSSPFKYESKHEMQESDLFGYAFIGQSFQIHLKLSVRAYVQMIERFPLSVAFMTKIKKSPHYILKATISNLTPLIGLKKGLDSDDILEI